jgi:hypothetical protein
MHILTGLLVARLLGLKKKDGDDADSTIAEAPLLGAPSIIAVTHALPGRTRFRVPSLAGRHNDAARLQETLGQIDAIDRVAVSAATGSVLFEYDADRVEPGMLAAALIRILALERELEKDVRPEALAELRRFGRSLNRAVYEKTNGMLDARTALFIILAVAGIQRLLKQGAAAVPAGFTLLWWAGNGLLGGKQTDA